MSPELKDFYKCLQYWIEDGLPDHPSFGPGWDVCDNLWNWAVDLELDDEKLVKELKSSFESEGLHPLYPFDIEFSEWGESQIYSNKARLEWIYKNAMED